MLIKDDNEIRAFKASVRRRALRIGLVLFIVSLFLKRDDITFGFLFGLCVGFINFDLMCRQNMKLLQGAVKGSGRRAVFSFLIRYALLAAAGVTVFLKASFNPIASLVGFFILHFILITYEFTESLKKRFLSVEDH